MSYPFYSFLFIQTRINLFIQTRINFITHVSKIKSLFVRESRLTLPKHLKVLLMITYILTKFIIRGDILEQLDLSNLYTIAVQLFKLDLYGNNPLKLFLVL